jgi:hypothetical protein
MLVVRCKDCNKEITSHPSKSQSCGCSNMMTVKNDSVSAVDLTRVVMVNSLQKETKNFLTSQDIAWQESRRQRKVGKLNYEVR